MTISTLNIHGMTCGGCVRSVTNALQGTAGVSTVAVDLAAAKATVEYDAAVISPQALVEVVDDIGFEASLAA